MRIATLQFAPSLGQIEANVRRADRILSRSDLTDVDLLVLPELAFTGYNFPSIDAIRPYLEPTASGLSTSWAKVKARELKCHVCVGYPEKCVDESDVRYNSQVIVSPKGKVVVNYRKSHLYPTDESWARKGDGFHLYSVPDFGHFQAVSAGICMDIIPDQSAAAFGETDLAAFSARAGVRMIVMSTAWVTELPLGRLMASKNDPDDTTISFWLAQLQPLLAASMDEQIVAVISNRCGSEPATGTGSVRYSGSSCVLSFERGRATILGSLGWAKEQVLIVDTEQNCQ